MTEQENLFPTIGNVAEKADNLPEEDGIEDEEKPTQEIESLCMKCHEQGVTRLLLTSIPFFREVIVMSFRCEHCGTANNEIQSAGTIRAEGTVYTARILARSDLDRQIVRSPSCEIIIPEYELNLPPANRGQLTTVEGLIRDIAADLEQDQALRRIQTPEAYEKIDTLLTKLKDILGDDEDDYDDGVGRHSVFPKASEKDMPMPAFTIKLDDPSGNSFIEFVGSNDPKWNLRTYPRTFEHNVALGLVSEEDREKGAPTEGTELGKIGEEEPDPALGGGDSGTNEEIFVFRGVCSSCGHPIDTLMKKVNIPYFKDIIIMSTNCDRCGYRDNEVKSGSAISEQGKKIILKVEDREDLSRDILKSETAGIEIPEIDLTLQHGTLGGRFTTLEGLLSQVFDELSEKVFSTGDSSVSKDREDFTTFLSKLKSIKEVENPFTIILDDPLANSYVQNIYAPDPDPNMQVEWYERTWDQNEELGLNDIKVENYEEGGTDDHEVTATAT